MDQQLEQLRRENQALAEENLRLKTQLSALENSDRPKSGGTFRFFGKVGSSIVLGRRLKKSLLQLYSEISNRQVQRETLSDVTAHVVWRLTRVSLLGLLIAVIPGIILLSQTFLMYRQNNLLDRQNTMQLDIAERQNKLMEVQNNLIIQQLEQEETTGQKSQYTVLVTNMRGRIDQALDRRNRDRVLSLTTIRDIAALSRNIEPYEPSETDPSIQLSPERGQLLIDIVNRKLNPTETCDKIFSLSTFDYANLKNAELFEGYLRGASLAGANFQAANLRSANLRFANLKNAHLVGAYLSNAQCQLAEFSAANAQRTFFNNASLNGANFSFTDLSGADLRGSVLNNANFTDVLLENTRVDRADWFEQLEEWEVKGLETIRSNYTIDRTEQKDASGQAYFLVVRRE